MKFEDAKVGMLVRVTGTHAVHFEHTIVVRKGKAEILSSFVEVEHLEGQKI